jgi:hypothetical protein
MPITRRSALQSMTGACLLGTIGRSQAQVTPEIATFAPEIEPLVSLIERTPRDKCAEMAAAQLKDGVSYRQLMAALFLAGIRNVNPRPPGFALHCVFIIHAAHLISLEAPADSRLLPLFYALDVFKASQERDAKAAGGDYVMQRITGPLPSARAASKAFVSAMESWDQERAERSVAALARYRSAPEVFESLWSYGARDYRNIGHKAIYVANAERTLQAIGWQHAEPVLRSLVLSLLDFGPEQQVNGYAFTDQCYAGNLKLAGNSLARLDNAWAARPAEPEVTKNIVKEIRTASPEAVCAAVTERLVKGSAGPATVWDAVHLASAELRMRASGGASIVGIHAVTACNGLHHAYVAASDPAVRLLVLLQAVGWMGQFRTWAETRKDGIRDYAITDMEPSADDVKSEDANADVFANLSSDASAARVMRLSRNLRDRQAFLSTALRFTLAKADEVHYYKYMAALIEDIPLVSEQWQPHMTAASVYYSKGLKDPEPAWAKSARAALGAHQSLGAHL